MTTTFELGLIGAADGSGEIRLSTLVPLAAALQDVATKVGRHVEGRSGAGRSPNLFESLTALTLTSLREGSTILRVRRGDDQDLGLDLDVEHDIDDRLYALLAAVGEGRRPSWVGDALAASTGALVEAVRRAASEVSLTFPEREVIRLRTSSVDLGLWKVAHTQAREAIVFVGRLVTVAVESARFQVRDDAGNLMPLEDVSDVETAARLVGQRVRASGLPVRDAHGVVRKLTDTVLELAPVRQAWRLPRDVDVAALLAAAPGPDPDGGVELDDDEYDDFLRAVSD